MVCSQLRVQITTAQLFSFTGTPTAEIGSGPFQGKRAIQLEGFKTPKPMPDYVTEKHCNVQD